MKGAHLQATVDHDDIAHLSYLKGAHLQATVDHDDHSSFVLHERCTPTSHC